MMESSCESADNIITAKEIQTLINLKLVRYITFIREGVE